MLLPGLDGTGKLFAPLLKVLPLELPAKVCSYPADQALDLDKLASLVARQLPPEKVILLAESFSGLVALKLLASVPARFRGVIFVGAFAEPPRPFLLRLAPLFARSKTLLRSAPSFMLRNYCLGSEATAEDLALVRDAISSVAPEVVAHRLSLVGTRHSHPRAPFQVPAGYLRPTGDRLVPASAVDWFKEHFADCKVEDIEGPHFILQARPTEAARLIARMTGELADR